MTQLPGPPAARTLLAEQLMLLAFPAEGPLRMGPGSYLSAGLVGAVLTELTIGRCVTVDQQGRSAGRYRVVPLGPGRRRLRDLPGQRRRQQRHPDHHHGLERVKPARGRRQPWVVPSWTALTIRSRTETTR